MPWEAVVSGLFALLAAVTGGSFFLRWFERLEQRRRWESFRRTALERVTAALLHPYAFTTTLPEVIIAQSLSDAGYAPEDITDRVLAQARLETMGVLYELAIQAQSEGATATEEKVLDLLATFGERWEELPPRLTAPAEAERAVPAREEH